MKLSKDTRLVVLTGAGISAESGIRTFRDADGLWEDHRVEDIATPKGFRADPARVWQFYKARYQAALAAKPNPAHLALVELESWLGANFSLITQNVDGLHSAAGSAHPLEMHGSLLRCFCTQCRSGYPLAEIDLETDLPACPDCGASLRPDVVWFGEIPYFLEEIANLVENCDLFLMVGTSGVVYPAAGFVMAARFHGAKTVAVNLDKTENQSYIDEFHSGKAGEILPALVREWIT